MNDLFPDAARALVEDLEYKRNQGMSEEFRNLCIRKVDLVLVRNYAENERDEFVARISAHAQHIITQNGSATFTDEDVVPFVQFWMFGYQNRQWKLKAVLPSAEGDQAVRTENIDEGASPEQLQWYYRQPRAN